MVRARNARRITTIQKVQAAHTAEYEETIATIERLKARITEIEVIQAQHALALEEARAAQLHDEVTLAQSALDASASNLRAAHEVLERIRDVRRQLQQLHRDDPQLQKDVEQFHAFDPTVVEQLPAVYRQPVLEVHEQLRARVAPCLHLEDLARHLPSQASCALDVLLVSDPEQARIIWVLPFRISSHQTFESEFLCTSLLEKPPEGWTILELSEHSWLEYRTLHAVAEYQGMDSLTDASAALMTVVIKRLLELDEIVLHINVAELDLDAWRSVQSCVEVSTSEPVEVTPQQLSHEATNSYVESIRDEIAVASEGWYTSDDVDSWNRPLKTVEGSRWNSEARRLRTLLIRMMSHGAVGSPDVPRHLLWGALPEPHRTALDTGIARLEQHHVLIVQKEAQSDQWKVAINPLLLSEVQDLINQDVTPFWEPIVTNAEASFL